VIHEPLERLGQQHEQYSKSPKRVRVAVSGMFSEPWGFDDTMTRSYAGKNSAVMEM
jgi:hypothetical protein